MTRRTPHSQKKQMIKKRIDRGWDPKVAATLPRMPTFKYSAIADWQGTFEKVWNELNQNG